MTEITVKPKTDLTIADQIDILEMEIYSGTELLRRRRNWLDNPVNKMKSTYASIVADTREMEEKLDEKKAELETLKKKIA